MTDRHNGMIKDHPGAGKTHDFPDFFTHVFFVAMYFAVGTEGFRLHEGAFIAALSCVGFQCGTIGAKFFLTVLFTAVNGDHQGNGFFFPLPFGFHIHQLILPCSTE